MYYYRSSSDDEYPFGNLRKDEYGRVEIYTDGCCLDNGKHNASAGIGIWFNDDHSWNVSAGARGRQTNNTAEYQAVSVALSIARKHGLRKIRILTDSNMVYSALVKGWIEKWEATGWVNSKGKPLTNIVDIHEVISEQASYLNHGGDVKYQLVPAHTACEGNNKADRLAKAGAAQSRRN